MKHLIAFGSGVVFAMGLVLGGMTRPAKILAFLDVTGRWDPGLALVMAGPSGFSVVNAPYHCGSRCLPESTHG